MSFIKRHFSLNYWKQILLNYGFHTSEEASGEWRCVELGQILHDNNFQDIFSFLRKDLDSGSKAKKRIFDKLSVSL